MADRDYYELLEVPRNASEDEIIKSYKTLSKRYHPDKNLDKKEWAEEMFKAINEAKNVLTDPEQRRIYDQVGKEGLKNHKQGGGGNGFNPFDVFSNIFGGGNNFERVFNNFGGNFRTNFNHTKNQVQQKIIEVHLSLEQVYKGQQMIKKLKIENDCNICEGIGKSETMVCNMCNGSGVRLTVQQIGPGMIAQQTSNCGNCNTKGKVGKGADCKSCEGKRKQEKIISLELNFPPGTRDGMVLNHRVDNIDFLFIAKIDEHPIYKRKENNDTLSITRNIDLHEALTGVQFNIPTLDGREVTIATPHNFIIKPNTTYKVKDLGLNKSELLVNFDIAFPDNLEEFKTNLSKTINKSNDKEIYFLYK